MTRVSASDMDESRNNRNIDYAITSGNQLQMFQITSSSGKIILVDNLDRETQAEYRLKVMATDRGEPSRNASTTVVISVEDVNDHTPQFNQTDYVVRISESLEVGATVLQITASDEDYGDNSRLVYDITSGNDHEIFAVDASTGVISLREPLDYDTVPEYKFIIRASDSNRHHPLSALATVHIILEDENDNSPQFPVDKYLEFVPENSPVGSSVFIAHANDMDQGKYGTLNYSISSGEDRDKFSVDPKTGLVTTLSKFDYEERQAYYFTLKAIDIGGKSSTVSVQVNVESKDEVAPVFNQYEYEFSIPNSATEGTVLGRVEATDKDKGPDGRVFYSLRSTPSSKYFRVNRTTGEIILRRPGLRDDLVKLEVVANSGIVGSLRSNANVLVFIGGPNSTYNSTITTSTGIHESSGGLATWAVALLVILIVIVLLLGITFLFMYRRHTHARKPAMADQFDTSFDTIDIRQPPTAPTDLSQYPPRYNDLPHYDHHGERGHHHGNTTSEMSEQSQSASSGRGSADDNEDVEDEEIRMINEGPLIKEQKLRERLGLPDSGIHDDDNMSDVSVHNTQEYLARLGIDTSKSESTKGSQDLTHAMGSMHMFDDEGGGEGDGMDISNLIYAKLNEVTPEEEGSLMDGTRSFGFGDESQPSMTGSLSSIVHSEEELQGSYNWDYLLDWGPQYQPLAHVFSEIARLKDDSAPNQYSREPQKKTLNPQVKTIPPPLLTSVAPRSIAPVALSSVRTSQMTLPSLPRSPISHESSFTSPAMSPSFSPSLSPLATRSPSISPLMTPGSHNPAPGVVAAQTSATSTPHHGRPVGQRPGPTGIMAGASSGSETELRI